MGNKQQTAVDYFFDKIKSNFEHDGDKFESVAFLYAICKEKERFQHSQTWDKGIEAHDKRSYNHARSWDDFDEYYEQTYGTDKLNKKQNERIIGNNNTF